MRSARLLTGPGGLPDRLYSSASPFNRPIPAHPVVDPRSAMLVKGLASAATNGGFVIALNRWTVPVYLATARTPRYRLALSASWAPSHSLSGVPIPNAARPDPASDGQVAVVDRRTRCEYDLWEARRRGATWSAGWANSLRTSGSGIYGHGLSTRGSGFALLAGLVRPEELATGRIDHALIFSYPYTSAAGFVAPATESDGKSTRSDAIPEGALLQLDPTLDVGSLPGYERAIARALQRYGMYLGDTSDSNVSLYGVSGQSYVRNPYAGMTSSGGYATLKDIPISRFRVIRYGPLSHRATNLVRSSCARFG